MKRRGSPEQRRPPRLLLSAGVFMAIVTVALLTLASRLIDDQVRDWRDSQQVRLQNVVDALNHQLDREHDSLLDIIEESLGRPGALLEIELAHPSVEHVFVQDRQGVLLWPALPEQTALESWSLSAPDLGSVHALLREGHKKRAIARLEETWLTSPNPEERAQVELLRARLIREDGATEQVVLQAYERVLDLFVDQPLSPWSLTAWLQRASWFEASGETPRAVSSLEGMLGQVAIAGQPLANDGTQAFFVERACERLRSLGAGSVHEAKLARLISKTDVINEWTSVPPHDERTPRRLARGDDVLVYRQTRETENDFGYVAALSPYVASITSRLESSWDSPGAFCMSAADQTLWHSADYSPNSPHLLNASLSPWTVSLSLPSSSVRGPWLLYGGLFLGVWVLVLSATCVTVRGLTRQIELANMRSRFVANVSHELKTPLTLIRMYAEILGEGYARNRDQESKAVEVIRHETGQLDLMLDNVLSASRIDSGSQRYLLRETDLGEQTQSLLEEWRPLFDKKGLVLKSSFEEGLPHVAMESSAFASALRNLLSNAMKYASSGGQVDVEVLRLENGVAVRVSDRGPGLPKGDVASLFERFERGSEPRQRHVGGTGLGLSIVRHVMDHHGGKARATSRPGGGAVFTLWFPIVERDASE